MYVQFLPLWFSRRMHRLGSHPVSAHVVQKDAWTPCLYSSCSERCITHSFCPNCSEGCLGSQSLLLLFRKMHAWTPCLYSCCSEGCMDFLSLLLLFRTMQYSQFLSLLFRAMHVRTSSFSPCCLECIDSPVSAFIVGGRPRNYLFLSEKWNRETSALPTSI